MKIRLRLRSRIREPFHFGRKDSRRLFYFLPLVIWQSLEAGQDVIEQTSRALVALIVSRERTFWNAIHDQRSPAIPVREVARRQLNGVGIMVSLSRSKE